MEETARGRAVALGQKLLGALHLYIRSNIYFCFLCTFCQILSIYRMSRNSFLTEYENRKVRHRQRDEVVVHRGVQATVPADHYTHLDRLID